MPDPQPRRLSEAEFNAIRERVLASMPDGLSEADFARQIGPRMEQALGEAENTPPSVSGGAASRYLGGALGGLKALVTESPLSIVRGLMDAQGDTAVKARDAFQQGRYSEAAGYGLGAMIPVIGPAAAHAGERIGQGDVAGGLGEATALLAPEAMKAAKPYAAPAARGVQAAARPVIDLTKRGARAAAPVAGGVAGGVTGGLVGYGLGEPVTGAMTGAAAGYKAGQALARRAPERPAVPAETSADYAARRVDAIIRENLKDVPLPTLPASETSAAPRASQAPPAAAATPQSASTSTAAPESAVPAPMPVKRLSPQQIRNEVGLAARRNGVALSETELAAADALVAQGQTPVEAVLSLKPRAVADPVPAMAVKPKLTTAEATVYAQLRQAGKSHTEALSIIDQQKQLAAALGTPSVEQMNRDMATRALRQKSLPYRGGGQ